MNESEIWHSLAPLQLSKYFISTHGRIKNTKDKIMALHKNDEGYMKVRLYKDDKSTISTYVHTLIGRLLLGCNNKITADHIDRDRSNNCLSNLRPATKVQQRANTSASNGRAKRAIAQRTLNNELIKLWDSQGQAEESGRFTRHSIRKACTDHKPYKGYLWEFYNDSNQVNEIWKSSKDIFPEYVEFFVSSLGRFRRNTGKTSSGYSRGGYRSIKVLLKSNNTHVPRQVHVLVLGCFEGREDNLIVNHKDGNKQNNRVDNLEYTTHSGNALHAIRYGLRKPRSKELIPPTNNLVKQSTTVIVPTYTLADALLVVTS